MDKEAITKSTGSRVDEEVEHGLWPKLVYVWKLLYRDKAGMLGLAMFLAVAATAAFAPWISPYAPLKQDLRSAKQPPAWTEKGDISHILGTDNLGRDMLSRIIYGSRVSLTVGFFGVLIAGSLGMTIGLVSGYVGGRVDSVIMGGVNMILALPYLVFVVFIASILGRSLFNVILIFGFTNIPIFARITRGEVLRLRESGFVESALSIGATRTGILFSHILPNLLG